MNLTLTLIIKWSDILKEYENQVKSALNQAEISGFRKGKAPRDLVEPNLDKNTLYSRCVEALLPKVYSDTIKAKNLKPILYPRIKVIKGELEKDWEFEAITCEAPKTTVGDYKSKPKDADIFKWLLDNSQVELPPMLIEEEVSHRLASLTDNFTKLGMTTEAYLSAKKTTLEGLKATLNSEATADLKMHFITQAAGGLDFLKTL